MQVKHLVQEDIGRIGRSQEEIGRIGRSDIGRKLSEVCSRAAPSSFQLHACVPAWTAFLLYSTYAFFL